MKWIEYLVRLRFHINGFYEDKLEKEYVEKEIRKKLSIPELEERGLDGDNGVGEGSGWTIEYTR